MSYRQQAKAKVSRRFSVIVDQSRDGMELGAVRDPHPHGSAAISGRVCPPQNASHACDACKQRPKQPDYRELSAPLGDRHQTSWTQILGRAAQAAADRAWSRSSIRSSGCSSPIDSRTMSGVIPTRSRSVCVSCR